MLEDHVSELVTFSSSNPNAVIGMRFCKSEINLIQNQHEAFVGVVPGGFLAWLFAPSGHTSYNAGHSLLCGKAALARWIPDSGHQN